MNPMDIYQALSDKSRRNILELLSKKGQLSSTDISNQFSISAPAISQHLKVLREARLIDMEKKAQQRVYTINTKSLSEIETWIHKMKTDWDARFGRLDKLLEEMKNG